MTKAKTIQLPRVDIRGMEVKNKSVGVKITINNHAQQIDLTTTPCHYGRERYWFICPYCLSRKAILYLGGSGLACRKCYRLSYSIENKTRSDRAIDGAFKINRRLGFDGDIDCLGKKPKGMHWQTFINLIKRRNNYSLVFWEAIGLYMNRRFGIG